MILLYKNQHTGEKKTIKKQNNQQQNFTFGKLVMCILKILKNIQHGNSYHPASVRVLDTLKMILPQCLSIMSRSFTSHLGQCSAKHWFRNFTRLHSRAGPQASRNQEPYVLRIFRQSLCLALPGVWDPETHPNTNQVRPWSCPKVLRLSLASWREEWRTQVLGTELLPCGAQDAPVRERSQWVSPQIVARKAKFSSSLEKTLNAAAERMDPFLIRSVQPSVWMLISRYAQRKLCVVGRNTVSSAVKMLGMLDSTAKTKQNLI